MRLFLHEGALPVGSLLERKALIKWNSSDQDTMQFELVQQSTYIKRLKRIVFNNKEVWNEKDSPDHTRNFTVVK